MSYRSDIAEWQVAAEAKQEARNLAEEYRQGARDAIASGDAETAKEHFRMAAAYDLNAAAIPEAPAEVIFSQREINYMNSKPSVMADPARKQEFMQTAYKIIESGVQRDSREFYEQMEHRLTPKMQDLVLPTPSEAVDIAFGGSKHGDYDTPEGKAKAIDAYNRGVRRLQDLKRSDPDRFGGGR